MFQTSIFYRPWPVSEPILILFDCDGTLLDSAALIIEVMQGAFVAQGMKEPQPAAIRRQIGLNLEHVISSLGMPDEQLHAAVEAYKQEMRWRRSQAPLPEPMFDGMKEWLHQLVMIDEVVLGIATGKSLRGLQASLSHHGILDLFMILRTPDHGPGKPDPFMVLDACHHLGIPSSRTIVIGDTTYDMMMAKSAGALALGVSWGYHQPLELVAAGAQEIMAQPASFCPVHYFFRHDAQPDRTS